MVGRHLESAEREVVVTVRERVLVEQHHGRLGRPAARAAAVHAVLQPFDGARRVLPRTVRNRRRLVGLLDAAADLLEDAVAQRVVRRQDRVGVGVLGLEVGDDVGVVALAQPVPVVDPLVAVQREHDGVAGSIRGCRGHRAASLNAPPKPGVTTNPAATIAATMAARSRRRFRSRPPSSTRSRSTRSGLVAAIVQDVGTSEVLMVAWMNREALERTLTTGRTWFWSRSRQEYWCKGETSGDRQYVREARYDCDMDVVLVVVEQEGRGACHTGERSCFFRAFGSGATPGPV